MCGIVGALTFNKSATVNEVYITKMRDTMLHRGPDSAGVWIGEEGRVGFGHRRLSIIDLSDLATQPMHSKDGNISVVFNGEIYNYQEIKDELIKAKKYQWKTDHSDTEVILNAYQEWGIECIKKFRGMFAIALWDSKEKVLWLIRDRIGVKPLYYSIHNSRITFASEIKALLEDPQQKRGVNEEALYHYLSFLTTPSPDTLFEGIHKLPPATWLRINMDGCIKQEHYWDVLDNISSLDTCHEEEIAELLLAQLRESVQLRKVSDVPVGIFLSGGVDSSTNAALFSEGEGSVKTFTIGYQGEYTTYKNELNYARLMADTIKSEHHERLLSIDDLLELLPKMVWLQDEPIADPVCFPLYYVSEMARKNGIIVCQVGEGADELFFGYTGWTRLLRLQQINNIPFPTIIKKGMLAALDRCGKSKKSYYEYLRRGTNKKPIFWGGAEAFTETQKKALLSPRMNSKFKNYTSWEALNPIFMRYLQKTEGKGSYMNWMSYLDLNLRLPELLLMRVDKMGMGVSLEGRVPFLDHKFVEFAMSIPDRLKYKNGVNKYILKKAVRGVIPDALIDRTKQGFNAPVHEWFFDRLGSYIKAELSLICKETDFFNRQEVNKAIEEGNGFQLWYLFNFALWWKSNLR